MNAPEPVLLCTLDPRQPAGRRACPCYNCRITVRGIKDDFDVEDRTAALHRQARAQEEAA